MRPGIFRILATSLLALVGLGCTEPRFEGIGKVAEADTAVLRVDVYGSVSATIDLKPIRSMLANAEWIDGDPIDKGGCWIQIDGHPDIFVSEVNGCFWIEGYRGLFQVKEDQIPTFNAYLEKCIQDLSDRNGSQRNEVGEQAGAEQPATRPESDSEGDDKPQPESEGRSR